VYRSNLCTFLKYFLHSEIGNFYNFFWHIYMAQFMKKEYYLIVVQVTYYKNKVHPLRGKVNLLMGIWRALEWADKDLEGFRIPTKTRHAAVSRQRCKYLPWSSPSNEVGDDAAAQRYPPLCRTPPAAARSPERPNAPPLPSFYSRRRHRSTPSQF